MLWHSKVDKIVKVLNINIKYVNPKKVYENVFKKEDVKNHCEKYIQKYYEFSISIP